MMKKFAVILLLLAQGCQLSSKKEKPDLNALKNEVMDIHDEAMTEMDELRRLRKTIMLRADSLQAADSLKANQLRNISDHLASANEEMMNWMRNFDPNFDGTYEEKLSYLHKKKAGIIEVRNTMISSQKKARSFLKQE